MSGSEQPSISGLWAFQRGKLAVRELGDRPLPPAGETGLAVRFAEVNADDAAALAKAMGHGLPERILDSLDLDRRCFVAWREEQIASYCWVSFQQEYVGEMERTLNLRPGEAYIWNCATLPDFRRQGIYTALLGYMLTRLVQDGMQRVWIGADLENVPSHRAFASAGFQEAALFTYLRLWRFYGFLTAAPDGATPQQLAAARRLFQLDGLRAVGPVALGAVL